jgi:hypothetical protein|tara:strand:- start:853 stop:1116 length:264 start_codon:yes stop_codon:yes gene_type:complete
VEWLKNKNGTYKLDRFGRRRYKITEGKNEMNNPFTLSYLLDRNRICLGVSNILQPLMCFEYKTIYNSKTKFIKINLKDISSFRINWD